MQLADSWNTAVASRIVGTMARPRRLAPAALAACRLEYETTTSTTRDLAARYGISKSALSERIGLEGWLRLNPQAPKTRRLGRAEGAVRAAVQAVEDRTMLQGLTRAFTEPPFPDKSGLPAPCLSAGLSREEDHGATRCDQPRAPVPGECSGAGATAKAGDSRRPSKPAKRAYARKSPARSLSLRSNPDRTPGATQGADIVPFPGSMPPSSTAQEQPDRATPSLDAALPRRRPDNSAKLRVELAALRGMLTARQFTLLDRHLRLLEDYSHLLQLYIAPHD